MATNPRNTKNPAAIAPIGYVLENRETTPRAALTLETWAGCAPGRVPMFFNYTSCVILFASY